METSVTEAILILGAGTPRSVGGAIALQFAETFWMVLNQPRSAWTYELDLRPFKEAW